MVNSIIYAATDVFLSCPFLGPNIHDGILPYLQVTMKCVGDQETPCFSMNVTTRREM